MYGDSGDEGNDELTCERSDESRTLYVYTECRTFFPRMFLPRTKFPLRHASSGHYAHVTLYIRIPHVVLKPYGEFG